MRLPELSREIYQGKYHENGYEANPMRLPELSRGFGKTRVGDTEGHQRTFAAALPGVKGLKTALGGLICREGYFRTC